MPVPDCVGIKCGVIQTIKSVWVIVIFICFGEFNGNVLLEVKFINEEPQAWRNPCLLTPMSPPYKASSPAFTFMIATCGEDGSRKFQRRFFYIFGSFR